MPIIDLRDQIVSATGIWQDPALLAQQTPFEFTLADTRRSDRLLLRWPRDAVTLAGPLRIRVTFQTENVTYRAGASSAQQARQPGLQVSENDGASDSGAPAAPPDSGLPINTNLSLQAAAALQASTVYSYALDIHAGQIWPFVYAASGHPPGLAANFCDRVLIEVAGFDTLGPPVACGDLPCNLARTDIPDTSAFFPTACEPCAPGAQVRMPALAPSLMVSAASGGCVRTRFFDGMSITREDLETEQRYFRIKNRYHNRTIGQGVVWGLDVGKQADHICVLPGIAIDCCGNDLTVTTAYRVEIAALLRDPAAAAAVASAGSAPQRMQLLLEYVECPSDPRPVHNDPCGPGQALCEPSRTRETVRLRLVPPRDPDDSGPLRDFLETAQALHQKYGQPLDTVTDLPPTSQLTLIIGIEESEIAVAANGTPREFTGSRVRIGARLDDGVFTGGMLRIVTSDDALIAETPMALLSLPAAPDLCLDLDSALGYRVEILTWRAESPLAAAPGWADVGSVVYKFSRTATGAGDDRRWQVVGAETQATRRLVPVRAAACGEPCAPPATSGREPGPCDPPTAIDASPHWPWLHADPLAASQTGDPKAVVLGIVGAWLQNSVAPSATPDTPAAWSFQRLAATVLYRSAWLLFYGIDATDDRQDVGAAIQELLRGWCKAALYPGPVCAGDPDGVVIGCTTLQAGTIGDVDPFGGRRYVVQYPLLTHWAAQIGLAPLDATITRLASLLCCVAALPRPTTPTAGYTSVIKLATGDSAAVGDVGPAGATQTAYLAFGSGAALAAAFKEETKEELNVSTTHELSFLLFASYVIATLRGDLPPTSGMGPAQARRVERYTIGGLFEPGVVSLLVTRGCG